MISLLNIVAAIWQVRFVPIGSMHFVELLSSKDKHRHLKLFIVLKRSPRRRRTGGDRPVVLSLDEIRSFAVGVSDWTDLFIRYARTSLFHICRCINWHSIAIGTFHLVLDNARTFGISNHRAARTAFVFTGRRKCVFPSCPAGIFISLAQIKWWSQRTIVRFSAMLFCFLIKGKITELKCF